MAARLGKCVVVGETRDAIKAFDTVHAEGELVVRTWFAEKEGLA